MNNVLDDLLSEDSHRIWRASWDIIASRDVELLDELRAALPRIRTATTGIDLGGLITPNSATLEHALTKVREFRSWTCWCDEYLQLLHFDPNREQQRGHVRILSEDTTYWPGSSVTECTVCGQHFTVVGGEHHSAWWKWTVDRCTHTASSLRE